METSVSKLSRISVVRTKLNKHSPGAVVVREEQKIKALGAGLRHQ